MRKHAQQRHIGGARLTPWLSAASALAPPAPRPASATTCAPPPTARARAAASTRGIQGGRVGHREGVWTQGGRAHGVESRCSCLGGRLPSSLPRIPAGRRARSLPGGQQERWLFYQTQGTRLVTVAASPPASGLRPETMRTRCAYPRLCQNPLSYRQIQPRRRIHCLVWHLS